MGAASNGNVTDERWAEYIESQTPAEVDDDFNVTELAGVRRRRTDPALSRNLKPPPFRRWSIHKNTRTIIRFSLEKDRA